MITRVKAVVFFVMSLIIIDSVAADKISVEVFTQFDNTAAIGFSVNGKEHGGLGNHMKGEGPVSQTYYFGMRVGSIFAENLDCGSLMLNQNSKVCLVVEGDHCQPELR